MTGENGLNPRDLTDRTADYTWSCSPVERTGSPGGPRSGDKEEVGMLSQLSRLASWGFKAKALAGCGAQIRAPSRIKPAHLYSNLTYFYCDHQLQ